MFTPHNRRSIRFKDYDYSQSGLYFVTICTKNRSLLFGDINDGKMELSEYGVYAEKCWKDIPLHFPNVILHKYVVMPNHIHGIIEIVGDNMRNNGYNMGAKNFSPLRPPQSTGTSRTIGSIVRGFKIGVTKEIGESPWQRNYHEHIIRDENAYNTITEYIEQNPLKWELDCYYGNE